MFTFNRFHSTPCALVYIYLYVNEYRIVKIDV